MTDSEQAQAATRRPRWRRRGILVPLGVAVTAVLAVALLVFEPWTLFTDQVVDEAAPGAVASTLPSPSPTPTKSGKPVISPSPVEPAEPEVLATGTFISHEHGTTGSVRVLGLDDGSRVLRIEGLDTSNGPDLRVWITDAPVIEGRDGWFVFDDGAYVDLGALKGNQGNQNYPLPDSVDLDELDSVSIWCARFRVSFGAAQLA